MQDAKPLEAIVLESKQQSPEMAIIWLHGLGADGNDFAPIVPELKIQAPIRFVFPHAPMQPVSINNGFVMRAWYDIRDANLTEREDADGLRESAQAITALIDQQIEQGIASDKIILAGFSQGGAVALHAGLRYPKPLAGIMALSTYLMCAEELSTDQISEQNKGINIFMGHGTQDPMVPIMRGLEAKQQLTKSGYEVEWHDYMMPHAVIPEEIADIASWLKARLAITE
jgi:phospholipase/carboxylesterase